ncbi:MAG TPA: hypothetical protein VMA96_04040 [Solirubrobacteraceae bacterium]|nr:hypothetical protein [Solirubrobacteraceae bacterium]
MSSAETAPYEALARMIERELELVGTGDYDALSELKSEREALISTLPESPPASARPALQRAALMNKRVEIEILRLREALLLEFANVERVSRTARGYSPPRQARPHVEATA